MENRGKHGFSLVELLVVMGIVAIISSIAVPSFLTYLQTTRLTNAAQNLYYALQTARTEAIKQNANVYVSFQTGTTWCYGVNANSSCACNTASNCTLGATQAPASAQLTLSATGLNGTSIHFEPNHGAAMTSSTITLTNGQGNAISVKISLLGSLLLCSSNVSGYPACS